MTNANNAPKYDEWMSTISQWQSVAYKIPAIVHNDIIKSKVDFNNPTHGVKSLMTDPLAVQYAMGYKDRKYSLTYDVLKRIPQQLGIVAAILQTRCNQVAAFSVPFRMSKSVGFAIKHRDPGHETSNSEREFIQDLERFIYNCGAPDPNPYNKFPRDDFETFLKKLVRDSITYDQACLEVVPDRTGQPYEFMAVDASTIRIAASHNVLGLENLQYRSPILPSELMYNDERSAFRSMQMLSAKKNGERPRFVQVINGQIHNVYYGDELAFGVRNPRTDIYIQGYGYGEMEQLVTILTAHLFAEEYNIRFFQQGSAPKGLLNFKGENFTPDQMEAFRRQWRANVEGVSNCVAGGTRVYTKEFGYESLENVCGDKLEVPVNIWTGTSWETGLVYKTPTEKVLCRTKLDNGVSLSTSPDHKIRTIGSSGDPEWKTQQELVVGDVVLVNKKDTSADTELLCLGKKVTPEFMETLGWLLGDGNISLKTNDRGYSAGAAISWYYHHEKEQEILDKHLAIIKEYFPGAYKYTNERSEDAKEALKARNGFKTVADRITKILLSSSDAGKWLIAHGFYTEKDGKTVPAQLFTMPLEYRCAYLRGMFSADGNCAKRRSPEVTICNDRVREDIKHLLNSVGIRTELSEGKSRRGGRRLELTLQKSFILRVKDRDTFFSQVGFLQEHKQPIALKKPSETNKYDRVPVVTLQKYLTKVRENNNRANKSLLTAAQRADLNSVLCGSDGCSKGRLIAYMQRTGVPIPSWLTEYNTATVVSTDNTGIYIPMFDVSVNTQDHAFVADNILCHNSWKTPIMQAEQGVEWIDLHPSNREMEYGQWIEYLLKIVCAVFLIDPAELNFDLHGGVQQTPLFESSQEWKLKASRDRGLKPLLRFIAKLINTNIVSKIDDHFVFDFVGLDELSEQEKHELRQEQVSSYMTLNEIRRAEDLPDVEDGDLILNPTYVTARQARMQMDQQKDAQEQQLQATNGAGDGTPSSPSPAASQAAQHNTAPQYADNFKKAHEDVLEISLDDYKDLLR